MNKAFPYVKLRPHPDGSYRPRFEPGPKDRPLGFVAADLKHPDGRWFNLSEASIYALSKLGEIKAARAAAKAGGKLAPAPRKAAKSVGDLVDAFMNSLEFAAFAKSTQDRYGFLAKPLCWRDKAARVPHPFARVPAAIVTRIDVMRIYNEFARAAGGSKTSARAIIMFLSACYTWGGRNWPELIDKVNPCTQLGLARAPERVAIWPVEAIRAIIAAADTAGVPSIGDAVMLALYTAQRQSDVLALVDEAGKMSIAKRAAAGHRIAFRQIKTGAAVAVFAAPDLVARLAAAEQRRAALKVVPLQGTLPVVFDERPGRAGGAWTKSTFSAVFRRLQSHAAKKCPAVKGLTFHDLRDTAITWLGRAGCTVPEICAFSGHSLQTAHMILKAYLELGEPIARAAADKQHAWLAANKISLAGGGQ